MFSFMDNGPLPVTMSGASITNINIEEKIDVSKNQNSIMTRKQLGIETKV